MAWISVYQEVDGPKLRRLARLLKTSKAESLGILNFLWFWGMNNADEAGKVLEAGREDIEDALAGIAKIHPKTIVGALFEAGWLDSMGNDIFIHDWNQWQEQWYKLQKARKNDADRKRRIYMEEKKLNDSQTPVEKPETPRLPTAPDNESAPTEKEEVATKEKGRTGPEKKKYAEFVRMTETNYSRLLELYGKEFADTCITELDLYKGSKGKIYKDDYRAILSWVVDRVREKKPGLLQKSRGESANPSPENENPYAEWGEQSG